MQLPIPTEAGMAMVNAGKGEMWQGCYEREFDLEGMVHARSYPLFLEPSLLLFSLRTGPCKITGAVLSVSHYRSGGLHKGKGI